MWVPVYADQPEVSLHYLKPGERATPLCILFFFQWDDNGDITVLSNKDL